MWNWKGFQQKNEGLYLQQAKYRVYLEKMREINKKIMWDMKWMLIFPLGDTILTYIAIKKTGSVSIELNPTEE